ncbi:MAG: NAD+ synthase [Candidatus Omnitrophica bacterium]|nr:NAD+ synthase [Candidatus Omnitrophota bacterium]
MQKRIVSWLKKEVKKTGAKGIILGLSGGIDSAVVAALSKKAVTSGRVLALLLPCLSQPQDLKDAKLVAKSLDIKTKKIDLSGLYGSLLKLLPPGNSLARANLKPRLRMLTLYYFANNLNYLVCGTGNKSELTVGYFTKYGDGGVDILPIGNLLKGQVRKLAEELGLPDRIITKPPTAGLWQGQTDEGEMGITYPELDAIILRLEKGLPQLSPRHKVRKVKQMYSRSSHKRQGPKICTV